MNFAKNRRISRLAPCTEQHRIHLAVCRFAFVGSPLTLPMEGLEAAKFITKGMRKMKCQNVGIFSDMELIWAFKSG
jgi:hypothetical protein